MNREEILSHVDHTLLKPEATWPQIQTLCDEAIANHTASVCINTCYVKQAVEYMAGRIPVCCVVGFPLGAMDTASKAFEAKTAIENGAAEVDMVINIGRLKNGEYDAVREDIRAVKQAVGDKVLKVIIETCLLTDDEDRGYVEREQKKLKPTLLGRAVDGLMLEQFPHIVDVDFSAEMEKNLDKVESGKTDWHKTVDDFYKGFAASLEQAEKNMEGKKVKVPDEPSSEVCDLCGRPMVIKVGKYGKFLACSGFPECRGTKRLVKDTGGICPKCGKGRMLERKSAKGRIYYGCERYPDCDFMTWDMPVAVKCEKCGSTLFRKGSKLYCAKEGCDFEMPVPKKSD